MVQVTEVIDIAPVLERKLEASLCHQTMLRNYVNQVRMQAKTGGWTLPVLDAVASGTTWRLRKSFASCGSAALRDTSGATVAGYKPGGGGSWWRVGVISANGTWARMTDVNFRSWR